MAPVGRCSAQLMDEATTCFDWYSFVVYPAKMTTAVHEPIYDYPQKTRITKLAPPLKDTTNVSSEHRYKSEPCEDSSVECPNTMSQQPLPATLLERPNDTPVNSAEEPRPQSLTRISSSPIAALKSIPRQFIPLAQLLERYRLRGSALVSRSAIATELSMLDPAVNCLVWEAMFEQYAARAVESGIALLGGVGSLQWIALHPHWYGKIPCDP